MISEMVGWLRDTSPFGWWILLMALIGGIAFVRRLESIGAAGTREARKVHWTEAGIGATQTAALAVCIGVFGMAQGLIEGHYPVSCGWGDREAMYAAVYAFSLLPLLGSIVVATVFGVFAVACLNRRLELDEPSRAVPRSSRRRPPRLRMPRVR